ncbi:14-3-3 protein sigma [Tritrichomonas foetus]|uniref:14-3-3 protein sigma n=1 Tax=Tritrichomonas foetus TaxID=1144522 RepID=A0A1J4J4F5_9EUKA|nr:14-3-3 protein sigma [Tritrichomonas foetus]|eukprot:OHS93593.1 14-3-3 protein sigma [Tritrichomonas foetus]
MNPRDKCIVVARIMKKANRHQTVISLMQEALRLDPKFNVEERNLITRAYKSIISERRESVRIISAAIEKENGDSSSAKLGKLRTMKNKIITEISNICHEFLEILDNKLIPNAVDLVAQLFYTQIRADLFRYLCELGESKDRLSFITNAIETYNKGINICKETYPKRNSIYLRLVLNYSVFLVEIVDKKADAISMLEQTFKECTDIKEDAVLDPNPSETRMLLQLIVDNLTIWQKGNVE